MNRKPTYWPSRLVELANRAEVLSFLYEQSLQELYDAVKKLEGYPNASWLKVHRASLDEAIGEIGAQAYFVHEILEGFQNDAWSNVDYEPPKEPETISEETSTEPDYDDIPF